MVNLRPILDKIAKTNHDKFVKYFYPNLIETLKREYYPLLTDKIIENFKLLPVGPVEDPTDLEKWADDFKAHLDADAENAFEIRGDELEIGLGDKKYLGIGQENDTESPTPIVWMAYFIADTAAQGMAGRFAFISRNDYETMKGEGSYKSKWGRFGEGFMVSEEEYNEEGWEEFLGPFDSKEHPLSKFLSSGQGPLNIFQKAFDEQEDEERNLFYFISKAVEKTLSKL